MNAKTQASDCRALLHMMLTLRLYDWKLHEWFARKLLHENHRPYLGMEACAAGVCANLRPSDAIFGGHRSWSHSVAKGVDLERYTAELFGRVGGQTRARGGGNAFSAPEAGVLYASAYVGDTVPMASGAALAAKMRGKDDVVISFFGDGAANTGACHEGLNLAAVWRLPVVFVCEDNQYAHSTRWDAQRAVYAISDRAGGYGMPGAMLDGNDVLAVYEAARDAVRRAREGAGPSLLDVKTFSRAGHFSAGAFGGNRYLSAYEPANPQPDAADESEIAEWAKKDPIDRFVRWLTERQIVTPAEIETMRSEISLRLEQVEKSALLSPYPERSEAHASVFFPA